MTPLPVNWRQCARPFSKLVRFSDNKPYNAEVLQHFVVVWFIFQQNDGNCLFSQERVN